MESIPVKACTRCGAEKPRTSEFFHRHNKMMDKLRPDCKDCVRAYLRGRYDHESEEQKQIRNRERYQVYKGLYEPTWRKIQACPVRRERERGRQRDKMRRFRVEKPEEARAMSVRASTKRKAVPGEIDNGLILELFRQQDGNCFYCCCKVGASKGRVKWHVDHVIPISRGGTNAPQNLVVACATCNLSKSNKMPWEWMPDKFTAPTHQNL